MHLVVSLEDLIVIPVSSYGIEPWDPWGGTFSGIDFPLSLSMTHNTIHLTHNWAGFRLLALGTKAREDYVGVAGWGDTHKHTHTNTHTQTQTHKHTQSAECPWCGNFWTIVLWNLSDHKHTIKRQQSDTMTFRPHFSEYALSLWTLKLCQWEAPNPSCHLCLQPDSSLKPDLTWFFPNNRHVTSPKLWAHPRNKIATTQSPGSIYHYWMSKL